MKKRLILQHILAVHKGGHKSIDLQNSAAMIDEYPTDRTSRRLNRAIFLPKRRVIIKLSRISQKHKSSPFRRSLYVFFRGPVRIVFIFPIFFVVGISAVISSGFFPETVHAGVVSSLVSGVSSLFKSSADQAAAAGVPVTNSNSQKIKLLEAPLAASAAFSRGEIAIVDETALVSNDDTVEDGSIVHPQSDQISVYVVHKGDTLSGIAKMYNVTVNTIVWANDLGKKPISVGQTLIILPISGVRYTVKAGDTIATIAKKYKGDVKDIIAYNNLEENQKLTVGDEIIVPDGEPQIQTQGAQTTSGSKSVIARFAGLPSYPGYYTYPAPGAHKTQGLHGHNAVDLGAPVGTPVLAAAGGTVIVSKSGGWNGGYGSYIVILHSNGTQTLYAHLSRNSVVAGAHVDQGQAIGNVGSTGESTGPHLHFEVRGAKNPF